MIRLEEKKDLETSGVSLSVQPWQAIKLEVLFLLVHFLHNHHVIVFFVVTTDPRIQTFPQEYDEGIPDSTLADFVLTHIVKFGDQLACVSFYFIIY